MGLFDYVYADDPRIVCSEGHPIKELQTKDLGRTMGAATIAHGRLTFHDGGWRPGGDAPIPSHPMTGGIEIYGDCHKCPAFVQADTLNLFPASADFTVALTSGQIAAIVRTSQSTADWLTEVPLKEYMAGCWGPMPYDDAWRQHVEGYSPERPWRGDQWWARRAKP